MNNHQTITKQVAYNLKIIFGNRFVYFFGASLLFYLLITVINIFSSDVVNAATVYSQIIFPGLLFIFFPTIFGVQNDTDARILEIIFGIPNYRYKVYLMRLAIILIIQWIYLIFLTTISGLLLVQVPVISMATRLLVPITFFGMVGFAFSTVIRNGSGTVVVLIIIGLIFFILSAAIANNRWNVFLNPYSQPAAMSELVWTTIVKHNRNIYLTASVILLLWGMLNLQKREKFMK
jgi:hypothetical protein